MKFGKHIQKRQLDLPEYAASFVDYKILKKLIKKLSATPIIPPLTDARHATPSDITDPQALLQANKATFFFRLERELEKVNTFYLQKEAELRLRLNSLLDKKRLMQSNPSQSAKLSSKYLALEEGFRQFSGDLSKLQQFVEVNATAFSKILKKWDKTSKSRTKELYISRAVEVQPCFNRDVISELSDQATTALLELPAWAEGEKMQYAMDTAEGRNATMGPLAAASRDLDVEILQAITSGNLPLVHEWITRIQSLPDAQERTTRAFLSTLSDAPDGSLELLLNTNLVNYNQEDEINERNCLHEAAICGRAAILNVGIANHVDARALDVYGRTPLHYACMHGRVEMIEELVASAPDTLDFKDQNKFTPLIHAIVASQQSCVEILLNLGARIDPFEETDHIPLNLACQKSSHDIVHVLLLRHPKIIPDAEGLYPQHLVARAGKLPQLLLTLKEFGVDLDQPDKLYQWTPLFHAVSEGHIECLKILLQSGVRSDIQDEKSLSAMYYATWEGHIECINLLAGIERAPPASRKKEIPATSGRLGPPPSSTPAPMIAEPEGIPDLILPPPIIPLRRYGHNFLDTKTFVVITFGGNGSEAVHFYNNLKYPAARLTISSRASDLIPRNIILPIPDEDRTISFQIDNLDSFAIDFDIYPTFGSKVIARTVASSQVFTTRSSSSGQWHSELFDARLRAIGRITFGFQVVKPFQGIPLEITHFATYWKATSQFESYPNALITGSSLSGDYVRLFVQLTADGVPVLYPFWKVVHYGLEMPVNSLTNEQFLAVGSHQGGGVSDLTGHTNVSVDDYPQIHDVLSKKFLTLKEALALLPGHIHIELHVLYPSKLEEERLRLGQTPNLNDFADSLLTVVFDHARKLREQADAFVRSMVFSSFNQDICRALNWKQPNYPVLLCNELGVDSSGGASGSLRVQSSGRTTISVKRAVQIAQENNFMGLICSSRLLGLAPALIEAIKTAGLVLITDISDTPQDAGTATPGSLPVAAPVSYHIPEGVDGFLNSSGVLRFNETVDM